MRDDISIRNVMLRLLTLLLLLCVLPNTFEALAQKHRQPRKPVPQLGESKQAEENMACGEGKAIIAASFIPQGREFDIKNPMTAMPNSRMIAQKCFVGPIGITQVVWFKSGGLEVNLKLTDQKRELAAIEYRVVSYDKARRVEVDKIYANENHFWKPNEMAPPDSTHQSLTGEIHLTSSQLNQVVFIQIDKAKFNDGSEWQSQYTCAPTEDISDIACQRKKR